MLKILIIIVVILGALDILDVVLKAAKNSISKFERTRKRHLECGAINTMQYCIDCANRRWCKGTEE